MKNKKTKTFEEKKTSHQPRVRAAAARCKRCRPCRTPRPSAWLRSSPLAACRELLAHGCSRCRIPNPPSEPSTWPSAPAGHTILPRHAAPAGCTSLPLHAAPVGLAPRSSSGATAHRERCSLTTRAAAVSRAPPVCSARARRLQLEEDKRRRGKRIR